MPSKPQRLSEGRIADFRLRHPIPPTLVGNTGLIVKDQGQFILVGRTGDTLFYLDMPATALDWFKDMKDNETRTLSNQRATGVETSYAAILAGAVMNPQFDPAAGGAALGSFVDGLGNELGKVTSPVAEGVVKALFAVRVFGIPVVILAGIGFAGYLLLPALVLRKAGR